MLNLQCKTSSHFVTILRIFSVCLYNITCFYYYYYLLICLFTFTFLSRKIGRKRECVCVCVCEYILAHEFVHCTFVCVSVFVIRELYRIVQFSYNHRRTLFLILFIFLKIQTNKIIFCFFFFLSVLFFIVKMNCKTYNPNL